MAEAYYCKQAPALYNAHANAPRLYKTDKKGKREYLSAKEAAATIAETEASVAEWCSEEPPAICCDERYLQVDKWQFSDKRY